MAFILAACLLLAAVLALLAWTLLRKPRNPHAGDLRERLETELEDDVAAGVLPAEDLRAAVGDLEFEAPADRAGSADALRAHRRFAQAPVWGLIALTVVAGVVIYWQTGNWRAGIYGDRVAVLHRANGMLAELQAHLKKHPDDQQGWITFGRAKSALGDYSTAAAAYAKAVQLDGEKNPELLALWGEAQVLADPEHPTAEERAIFAAVLKSDPDNVRGLWYGGMLALNAGKRGEAIADWQRLLGRQIPAPMAAFVKNRLAALGAPNVAKANNARPGTTGAPGPSIALTINVAPELAARIKPGRTIFVYVRKPAGGPPLAAKRLRTAQFPLHLTLDDGDAMLAGHDLASMTGKRVEVGAFLSASGDAKPEPNDPTATQTLTLQAGAQNLTLTLARTIADLTTDP